MQDLWEVGDHHVLGKFANVHENLMFELEASHLIFGYQLKSKLWHALIMLLLFTSILVNQSLLQISIARNHLGWLIWPLRDWHSKIKLAFTKITHHQLSRVLPQKI
tara:strand:- start:133 stop:450 length:318 start_codon:yes stop_codon:yes gene_type:complete